ncbi:MAG: hypothetical protein ACK5G7_00665 [Erysipelotrichaceae bacterium]
MSNVKFEECFLKNKNKFMSVEDLRAIHDRFDGSYEKEYNNHFYCPECYLARLSFHPNAKTPHFRSLDNHDQNCAFNFQPLKNKEVEKYFNIPINRDAISRKLNSCLDLLNMCSKQTALQHDVQVSNKKEGSFIVGCQGKNRCIRRKKLTAGFNQDDYGICMIFYGRVSLEWDLRNENIKYIRIKSADKKTYICSVSMSSKIYDYIKDDKKFDDNRICNVAFMSSMEKKGNFNNCKIKYSTELALRF